MQRGGIANRRKNGPKPFTRKRGLKVVQIPQEFPIGQRVELTEFVRRLKLHYGSWKAVEAAVDVANRYLEGMATKVNLQPSDVICEALGLRKIVIYEIVKDTTK